MNNKIIIFFIAALISTLGYSEDSTSFDGFSVTKKLDATNIKNQYRSGTCWSFAGLSFIESELIRMGKDSFDLSEMFIVKNVFLKKAIKYIRLHGALNFSDGGEFNDVFNVIYNDGIVPEKIYNGKNINEGQHIHGEMNEVLQNYVDAVIKNENDKLTPVWLEGFDLVLNAYLGSVPEQFTYEGKRYTPKKFADYLDINIADYLYLTSFMHHPFYEKFILEVPDNWSWGTFHNIPADELVAVIKRSIQNGYTVGWAGDISEDYYSWEQGIANVPDDLEEDVLNQKARQTAFDNYETTDDHGMHIIGIAENEDGEPFFLAKNSWGTQNAYHGYIFLSQDYVYYKTTSILINKNALSSKMKRKLGY
jgi:bleomycin hydrolase